LELEDVYLYVVMHDNESNAFATSCMAMTGSWWRENGKIGWMFQAANESMLMPRDRFNFSIYWAPINNFSALHTTPLWYNLTNHTVGRHWPVHVTIMNNESFPRYAPVWFSSNDQNDTSAALMKFKDNEKTTINLNTSFLVGTQFVMYFQQYNKTSTDYVTFNERNQSYVGNFTMTGQYKMTTPMNMTVYKHDNGNETIRTYLVVIAMDQCNGQNITTRILVATTTSSSSSNKLSTGAIVGIVIGCVAGACLILFAIWYFMRHRKSEERYEKLQ